MKLRAIGAATVASVSLALAGATSAAQADTAGGENRTVAVPVAFAVKNVNRTPAACPTDGASYTLRGQMIGPVEILNAPPTRRAVTLYLHGAAHGAFEFHFPTDPAFAQSYDYATELARAGHTSVIVDRLGYGASPKPYGLLTCLGAHADMAHQIIGELRSADYTIGSRRPIAFQRVALAGMSGGAAISELAAYTFGDIDALVNFAWADQGFSNGAIDHAMKQGQICQTGGEPVEPGGPGGYAYYGQTESDFRQIVFFDAEPAVMAADFAKRTRDPCGDAGSLPETFALNQVLDRRITVPVLLLFGSNDYLFTPEAAEQQVALYTGSSDVTLHVFEDTGHGLTLERRAPQVRAAVAAWLSDHNL